MTEERLVLLVEDNPDDEELTSMALREGHLANRMVVAHDGAEALEYLLDPARPLPAVVLLDLRLPRMSGTQVLERMRAEPRTRQVPVVVLTSSSEEEDRVISYRCGANSFVRKPVEFQAFVEAVKLLGMYWLLVNIPPTAAGE